MPTYTYTSSAAPPRRPWPLLCRALLQEESFNLESRIVAEVRELEQQAAQLACQIEQQQQQRREVLAEIVEVGWLLAPSPARPPARPPAFLPRVCQTNWMPSLGGRMHLRAWAPKLHISTTVYKCCAGT
jgi:hypothetical protein